MPKRRRRSTKESKKEPPRKKQRINGDQQIESDTNNPKIRRSKRSQEKQKKLESIQIINEVDSDEDISMMVDDEDIISSTSRLSIEPESKSNDELPIRRRSKRLQAKREKKRTHEIIRVSSSITPKEPVTEDKGVMDRLRDLANDMGIDPKVLLILALEDDEEEQRLLFNDEGPLWVFQYAVAKFEDTEDQYQDEINARDNAKAKIQPPTPLTNNDYSDPRAKRNKLWAKFMPSEILKMIFMLSVFNVNTYDKQVLNLILVCKYWRAIIYRYEKEKRFKHIMWYPLLCRFDFRNPMDWKHLVLIPEKYLELVRNLYYRKDMTEAEAIEYDGLIDSEHDEYLPNLNIPLLIACIIKCPRIYSLRLSGDLCEDLFYTIGHFSEGLTSIHFSFAGSGEGEWFKHMLNPESAVTKALQEVVIDRTYWIDDEAFWYLGQCPNLRAISAEKPWISPQGLESVFEGCTNLGYISISKGYEMHEGSLLDAFKILVANNRDIEVIDLECENGIDDECLEIFMDPKACPKLERLSLGTMCTQPQIDKLTEKRPNVECNIVTFLE